MVPPVLFLIFNRPQKTAASFAAIRKAKPPRLYVAADGPRPTHREDDKLCQEARSIIDHVDWPCQVHTLFRKVNLGGPLGIPNAIDWFFGNEKVGIILEDDVVGHGDFFRFCGGLLERYKNDARIMHITGNNFQLGLQHGEASYYFSKITHNWGWATWARAWEHYRRNITLDEIYSFISEFLLQLSSYDSLGYVPKMMLSCSDDSVGHWDARWWFSVVAKNGLSIVPNVNLTRNIGFGKEATHTRNKSILSMLAIKPLNNIVYANNIVWNEYADAVDYRICFSGAMSSMESIKKEIKKRRSEGVPSENIQYVAELGRKFLRLLDEEKVSDENYHIRW